MEAAEVRQRRGRVREPLHGAFEHLGLGVALLGRPFVEFAHDGDEQHLGRIGHRAAGGADVGHGTAPRCAMSC
jgi:hypothetical protein